MTVTTEFEIPENVYAHRSGTSSREWFGVPPLPEDWWGEILGEYEPENAPEASYLIGGCVISGDMEGRTSPVAGDAFTPLHSPAVPITTTGVFYDVRDWEKPEVQELALRRARKMIRAEKNRYGLQRFLENRSVEDLKTDDELAVLLDHMKGLGHPVFAIMSKATLRRWSKTTPLAYSLPVPTGQDEEMDRIAQEMAEMLPEGHVLLVSGAAGFLVCEDDMSRDILHQKPFEVVVSYRSIYQWVLAEPYGLNPGAVHLVRYPIPTPALDVTVTVSDGRDPYGRPVQPPGGPE